MNELVILGAGENGVMIADLIRDINKIRPVFDIKGFLDDDLKKRGTIISGYKVMGTMDDWQKFGNARFTTPLVTSPKTNHLKLMVLERLGIPAERFVNIIHPAVSIPDSVTMGTGNWIMPGAQIHPNVRLGNHIYLSSNCVIGFNTQLHDYCNISMGSVILGNAIIDTGCYVGANCSIFGQKTRMGKWSVIGMGSVVLKDAGDFLIVAGNPARPIGKNSRAQSYLENKPDRSE